MYLSDFSDFSITVQSLGGLNRDINCLLTWMADEGLLRENHRTVHFWDIIVGTFLCDINIHIYKNMCVKSLSLAFLNARNNEFDKIK